MAQPPATATKDLFRIALQKKDWIAKLGGPWHEAVIVLVNVAPDGVTLTETVSRRRVVME
jgi:hypothetical protein